jgi:putative ABC transport system substrate-binding protein
MTPRRREFITLLGGAASWPIAAQAQPREPAKRIMGVLFDGPESDRQSQRNAAAFMDALRQLGWTPGRNLQVEYQWAGVGADPSRIRSIAAELVALNPDVILANSSFGVGALRQQTTTIPIVFTRVTDPVGSGFVASLARPQGNITGFTPGEFSMFGKYPELLKEIAPEITQIAVMLTFDQSPQVGMWHAIEAVGPSIGVHVTAADVHDGAGIVRAIESLAKAPNAGLIVLSNRVTGSNRDRIIALVAQYRVPTIYPYAYFAMEGGLMSYGTDVIDLYRRSASYVDRILRGEKPGDLPVQQPTKFELVINAKTAKALGLTVPLTLLVSADAVIE